MFKSDWDISKAIYICSTVALFSCGHWIGGAVLLVVYFVGVYIDG